MQITGSWGAWAPGKRASLDLRGEIDGWSARLTDVLDAETSAFEAELVAHPIELPLFQRQLWVRGASQEHRLFQLRDLQGGAAMQIALVVERPRRFPLLGRARAWKLGPAVSAEAEWNALRLLRVLCAEAGDLVSLRLQPYRREIGALRDFESRARRAGYQLCDPVGVTRTLLVDLAPPPEELLAALSKKTRAKILHRGRASVQLRPLESERFIPSCVDAVNAAMIRTQGGTSQFDLAGAFAVQRADPRHAHGIGAFLPAEPDALLAFVFGFCHGEIAEYGVAGSLRHDALRSVPFNYWMLWQLIVWAREAGARWLDLGGITDGGPGDSLAGISEFKRHFTELDVELGRELSIELQPVRAWALSLWSGLRARRRAPKNGSAR